MFDRFCALLLLFYPAAFTRAYSADALQLIRDRARDERTVGARARLILDLVTDLLATSIRGYHSDSLSFARVAGTPSFDVILVHRPRADALVAGALMSVLLFGSFMLLFQPSTPPPVENNGATNRSVLIPGAASNASVSQASASADARHRRIFAIADMLTHRYFNRVIGTQLANTVLTHDTRGEYQSLSDMDLAARITSDIYAASHDLGIPPGVFVADVVYSAQPLPTGPSAPLTAEMHKRNRAALLQQHCLYERIETWPQNIGYLKLNGFADPTVCHDTTARAMTSLRDVKALVVDLRENRGGIGDTALQIAGYLFDRPAFMFDPRAGSSVPARTASPVPGNRLADKPVYVLTSSTTQSAAEYFVYNMKMLKRATIVGEKTAGHEHSGGFYTIDDHFGIGIRDAMPPDNPYAVKGWELIGIEPDVAVSAAEAVDAARKLMDSRTSH
jgi:hypothetical protein